MVIAGPPHPGRRRCDDPGLRAQPAVGRDLPATRSCGPCRSGVPRPPSARPPVRCSAACSSTSRAGRACSGSTPASPCRLHGAHRSRRSRSRATRPAPRSIDYAGTVLIALTLDAADPRRQQERRLGLDLGGDPRLLRASDRGRASPSWPSSAGGGAAARPGAAPQPDPGRRHHRDPDRRRHHQRPDVPAQPLLPGPRHARLHPARGRPGDAAGDRRAGRWSRRWCPGWRTSSAAGR